MRCKVGRAVEDGLEGGGAGMWGTRQAMVNGCLQEHEGAGVAGGSWHCVPHSLLLGQPRFLGLLPSEDQEGIKDTPVYGRKEMGIHQGLPSHTGRDAATILTSSLSFL